MENKVRAMMLAGQQPLGTFFMMGGAYAVEALGLSGLDYLIVDTEHGPFDVESAADCARAAKLRGITPFVRIKDTSRSSVLKMLDIGMEGLVVPCVNSVEEVQKLVEYAKYYPLGLRGVAFGRGTGWGQDGSANDLGAYFQTANREQLLIPQCETAGCLANIEEIAAIDGVDGIFIGPFDLSVALGKPAVFDDAFKAAVARILAACKKAGKFSFVYTGDVASARAYYAQGFDSVTLSGDVMVFMNAFRQLIADTKG